MDETTGEVWSEIDLDAELRVLPLERMKANREHRGRCQTRSSSC
jgi:hypothetical protein